LYIAFPTSRQCKKDGVLHCRVSAMNSTSSSPVTNSNCCIEAGPGCSRPAAADRVQAMLRQSFPTITRTLTVRSCSAELLCQLVKSSLQDVPQKACAIIGWCQTVYGKLPGNCGRCTFSDKANNQECVILTSSVTLRQDMLANERPPTNGSTAMMLE
jgi:hypothetical protein